MNTIDYAAEELGISSQELLEAMRRGRIRAEREARRRYDGSVAYQPITQDFALFQSIKDGFVSRLVLGR